MARHAADFHTRAMAQQHVFDDRQPQPGAAGGPRPRLVDAEESFENPLLIGERDALLSDFRYHNTGIGWLRSQERAGIEVELAPGVSPTGTLEPVDDRHNGATA